jgi:hypothetical protein
MNPAYEEAAVWKLACLDALRRPREADVFMSAWSAAHQPSARLWNNWANHLRTEGQPSVPSPSTSVRWSCRPHPSISATTSACSTRWGAGGEAVQHAREWLGEHGPDAHVCHHTGRILLDLGRYGEALELLDGALASAGASARC